MPNAWVYILKSKTNSKYYVGATTNIVKRIKKHKSGQVYSTKRIGNLELVFKQKFKSLSQARKVEFWIKSYKKRNLISKIIKDGKIKKEF